MSSVTVLFLEDDPDLATVLQRVAEELCDCSVICAHSLQSMTEKREEVLRCAMAFLDIDLGAKKPTGIEAFSWLRDEGFSGPIFFLTAHGTGHPLVERAKAIGETRVLSKPISPAILTQLLRART